MTSLKFKILGGGRYRLDRQKSRSANLFQLEYLPAGFRNYFPPPVKRKPFSASNSVLVHVGITCMRYIHVVMAKEVYSLGLSLPQVVSAETHMNIALPWHAFTKVEDGSSPSPSRNRSHGQASNDDIAAILNVGQPSSIIFDSHRRKAQVVVRQDNSFSGHLARCWA